MLTSFLLVVPLCLAPAATADQLRHWLLPWELQPGSDGSSGGGGEACSAAAAEGFLSGGGAGGGMCSAKGCLSACAAVHAWLQLVLGALLPLTLMWLAEERSRHEFQRHWLALRAPHAGIAGTAPSGGAPRAHETLRAVPRLALAVWLAVCAWAAWAVLDTLLLH